MPSVRRDRLLVPGALTAAAVLPFLLDSGGTAMRNLVLVAAYAVPALGLFLLDSEGRAMRTLLLVAASAVPAFGRTLIVGSPACWTSGTSRSSPSAPTSWATSARRTGRVRTAVKGSTCWPATPPRG